MSPLLDKSAIPRITQEIFYTCSSDGSKEVNIELTLETFLSKLKRIDNKKESSK